jgi:hypothetical protein
VALVDLTDAELVLLAQLCEKHADRIPEAEIPRVQGLARRLRIGRESEQKKGNK